MMGLFVAYLDRTNLSVSLPSVAHDLGFSGADFAITSSWALTIFLIGYAFANVLGGILTRRHDPKAIVIWSIAIWSVATLVAGFANSIALLLACRLILGVAEGIYWPQQSRFAKAWFSPGELTKANSLIQYHGQYLALALGFMILTPIYDMFGWRILFFITGGLGLLIIVPLYMAMLRPESEAPYASARVLEKTAPLTLRALGGFPFLLLLFSYVTQGMLFWGITLWIPLAVRSLGFAGMEQAIASALPYFAAVAFAMPMASISDRTRKRVSIAAAGLLLPGLLLLVLPLVDNGYMKLALITLALGYYASSFTANFWSIIQSTVDADAIGPASGIINGVGAGAGGTLAGFLVGLLYQSTGSYMSGFFMLGLLVVLGGLSVLIYGRLTQARPSASPASGPVTPRDA
jgi:predicted MFS family arabinose efflux permease